MCACSISFTLANDPQNKNICARRSRLPLKINMTMRDGIQVICTISKVHIMYKMDKAIRLSIFQRCWCAAWFPFIMRYNTTTEKGAVLTPPKRRIPSTNVEENIFLSVIRLSLLHGKRDKKRIPTIWQSPILAIAHFKLCTVYKLIHYNGSVSLYWTLANSPL